MKRILSSPRMPHATLAVAAATLAGAFAFQHVGGYEPCPICIWQRWPYVVGIVLLAGGLASPAGRIRTLLTGIACPVFLGGAGLSAWHAGIEYGFWAGPASCGEAGNLGSLSGAALLDALEATPMVRCDAPQWTLGGVSLAGFSALVLLGLAAALAPSARDLGRSLLAGVPPGRQLD